MSKRYISVELRRRVAETAQHRCGYCLSSEELVGFAMHIEHIIPEARGGTSDESNLWLACPSCNGHKATRIDALDPQTGQSVRLFNPRFDRWQQHFRWSANGTQIIGQTALRCRPCK